MRLLYIRQTSPVHRGVEAAFEKLGIDYEVFDYKFHDMERDETFCEQLDVVITQNGYDVVFSMCFIPIVSNVCQKLQIKYLSWVYECPLLFLNQESMLNSCNEVFFFDRVQAYGYASAGVNAHHLPFAVDAEYYDRFLREDGISEEVLHYTSEVSLVADIYKNGYSELLVGIQSYLKGYLEGIVSAQSKLYGAYLIPELVSDDLVAVVRQGNVQIDRQDVEYMLACEVTNRERLEAVNQFKSRYNTAFYKDYNKILSCLPLVYAGSRINLNITNKAVQSGIVPEALAIMACGGFLLTNYQDEVVEYLNPGVACVVYESLGDMLEKAEYYLGNESERHKIALAGHELVGRDFTFYERIKCMLESIKT